MMMLPSSSALVQITASLIKLNQTTDRKLFPFNGIDGILASLAKSRVYVSISMKKLIYSCHIFICSACGWAICSIIN
jgi:hypothetical protein